MFARGRTVVRVGFTLIELLVVVAIIALLISILLPSLNEARRQSRAIVCLNNLRTQGQVTHFYAEDNRGWACRGIAGYNTNYEWGHYSTYALKYYNPDLKFGRSLWTARVKTTMVKMLRTVAQFQCPDHPVPWNPFDYISNAYAIPYTVANIDYDVAGGGYAGDEYQGEIAPDYNEVYQINQVTQRGLSPSRFILATEVHTSLAAASEADEKGEEIRFHSTFLTSQLPFGLYPRVASDRRHPGGLASVFWDGSGQTLALTRMDAGFGKSLGLRLRYFTVVPPGYE